MKNENTLAVTWSQYSFKGQDRQTKTC